ncbi:MAG: SDR family oxidoreductase, partial [Chloroflexi bacterium]|nr:SDR family oxidoreductase [Chloroflexota bacterium]
LAEKLLAQGRKVAATARTVSQIADLSPRREGDLVTASLDVTREEQIRGAVAATLDRFGHIDVLVNNAGYGYFATQEEGDVDEIRRMFETNIIGLIRVTQAVLPTMRARGSGVIINLSSIAGRVAFPRSGFYNASKWAVEALSESLFYEVHPCGIRVVVIEPGAYATDFGPRSAVRSPKLTDPESPYAQSAQCWSDVAADLMPDRQDPAEVVEGVIQAAHEGEPFMRIPFGKDATPMVDERESVGQAEFIRAMTRRYYGQ